MCGLPGSGKTAHAKLLTERLHAIRLAPDEWMNDLAIALRDEPMRERVERLQWKLGRELLALGLIVIIEWGTWARIERDKLRLEARALDAAVELHYQSAPVDVLFERIQRRGIETPLIQLEELRRWADVFQVPTPDELALFDSPCFLGTR